MVFAGIICSLLFIGWFFNGIQAVKKIVMGLIFPYEWWTKQDATTTNTQHWWFVLGTTMINAGIAIATLVPLALYWILGGQHFQMICNVSLCLGAIPAFVLLYLAYCCSLEECIPYLLTLKQYWKNVLGLSLAWFIYDFVMYSVR
ncbi:hypothetical protein F5141DRAFT_1142313 [Pisolithus sp. B1]|nr:hypothetical protein F5141DRAFT_1142313 [Pisolithus sp. B1]